MNQNQNLKPSSGRKPLVRWIEGYSESRNEVKYWVDHPAVKLTHILMDNYKAEVFIGGAVYEIYKSYDETFGQDEYSVRSVKYTDLKTLYPTVVLYSGEERLCFAVSTKYIDEAFELSPSEFIGPVEYGSFHKAPCISKDFVRLMSYIRYISGTEFPDPKVDPVLVEIFVEEDKEVESYTVESDKFQIVNKSESYDSDYVWEGTCKKLAIEVIDGRVYAGTALRDEDIILSPTSVYLIEESEDYCYIELRICGQDICKLELDSGLPVVDALLKVLDIKQSS